MSVLFVGCAIIAIGGAAGVILFKTPVHSAMALVVNFLGLAALYVSLTAEFLAVMQIIIYAGAVMVLFLFVIALLTATKDPVERSESRFPSLGALGTWLGAILVGILAVVGIRGAARFEPGVWEGFGTVGEFGQELLTTYVLPFELTAFVLMVAVIGVVILVGRKIS